MRAVLALLVLALTSPLVADDVYLTNGRVFEDVETEVVGSKIIIHLTYGEIGFALEAVERVEESTSSHALFRQRRDELRSATAATAEDWLDLALWARGRRLEHGTREAALTAAAIDPRAPGLESLLRDLDYVFDPSLDRWISRDEQLIREGYSWIDGQWVSPEQQLARARMASEVARAREADQERRLTQAVLALAAAQLAQAAEPEPSPEPVYAWPVAVFPNPFIWRHPNPHDLPPPGHDPTAIPIERRQPGSLFPIQSRGGIEASGDTTRTSSGSR